MTFPPAPLAHRDSSGSDAAPGEALRVLDRLVTAFNAHDADAFAALFASDAWFLNVLGFRVTGRDAIAATHRHVFQTVLADAHVRTRDVASRMVGADVALIEAVWEDDPSERGASAAPARAGIMTLLLSRDGEGRWGIVSGANVEFPVVS